MRALSIQATLSCIRSNSRPSLQPLALAASGMAAAQNSLLNVSYDVAREFYKDYNTAFVAHYKNDGPGCEGGSVACRLQRPGARRE